MHTLFLIVRLYYSRRTIRKATGNDCARCHGCDRYLGHNRHGGIPRRNRAGTRRGRPAYTHPCCHTQSASDVIGPTGQGIAAAEFAELLRAMREGATYVNVHTDKHPSGEIRGQIK